MTRTITTLTTTLILLLTTTTHANTQSLRDVLANELNGTITQCVTHPDPKDHCFNLNTTTRIAQLQIENLILQYTDASWARAWEQQDRVAGRILVLHADTGRETYGIFLLDRGNRIIHVLITRLNE